MDNGEIILYQSEEDVKIEVRLNKDTVWLNRQQMALLFNRDVKTIGKHINNVLVNENHGSSTVAKFAIVQQEGGRTITRNIEYYSLDVIVSVGSRVKSLQGSLFKKWADSILMSHREMSNEHSIIIKDIPVENLILTINNKQVMLDSDLAMLYGVETKRLNEQVRRNLSRFPSHFRYQLSEVEFHELVANCDRLSSLKHSSIRPYVFTEQGVAMLSTVLRSETAVAVSIQIIDAFVSMRHFLASNEQVFHRLEVIEHNQLEMYAHLTQNDRQIEEIFRRIDQKNAVPTQGIFFDGQIFDAYTFVSDLIRSAKSRIVLLDNYIDDTVLTILDKRQDNVEAQIYTKNISSQLSLDIAKHNAQYQPICITTFNKVHDRFLCIDNTVYHIGASLKDLGKKWFAFSKMEMPTEELLSKIIVSNIG